MRPAVRDTLPAMLALLEIAATRRSPVAYGNSRASWAAPVLAFMALFAACAPVERGQESPPKVEARQCVETFDPAADLYPHQVSPHHATGFRVTYHLHYKVLELGPEASPTARFVLVRCGTPAPRLEDYSDSSRQGLIPTTVVEVPVRSVATTSTTELAFLDALQLDRLWVGHADTRFVSTPALRRLIESGSVTEIGGADGLGLDLEKLLQISPDLLIMDNPDRSGADRLRLLTEVGTTVVPMPAFRETSPLGRSEWLLAVALFFDQEERALEVFSMIENGYQALQQRVAENIDPAARPSVLTGGPWQGVWWVPGGESFVARLLADAGAEYPWAEEKTLEPLGLDIERVYEKASDADFWLYPSHWRSLTEIAAVDSRLARFKAFREHHVYAADLRLSPNGGNDYWELGVLRSDLVLADLVSLFHPRLLPDHEPVFHRRLSETAP